MTACPIHRDGEPKKIVSNTIPDMIPMNRRRNSRLSYLLIPLDGSGTIGSHGHYTSVFPCHDIYYIWIPGISKKTKRE
jgi:hypothetical protein